MNDIQKISEAILTKQAQSRHYAAEIQRFKIVVAIPGRHGELLNARKDIRKKLIAEGFIEGKSVVTSVLDKEIQEIENDCTTSSVLAEAAATAIQILEGRLSASNDEVSALIHERGKIVSSYLTGMHERAEAKYGDAVGLIRSALAEMSAVGFLLSRAEFGGHGNPGLRADNYRRSLRDDGLVLRNMKGDIQVPGWLWGGDEEMITEKKNTLLDQLMANGLQT